MKLMRLITIKYFNRLTALVNSDNLNYFNTSRMTTRLKEKPLLHNNKPNSQRIPPQNTKIPKRLVARKFPIKVPFSWSPGCLVIQWCFITSWCASQRCNTTLSRCCSGPGYQASSCTGGSGGAGRPDPTGGSPRTCATRHQKHVGMRALGTTHFTRGKEQWVPSQQRLFK